MKSNVSRNFEKNAKLGLRSMGEIHKMADGGLVLGGLRAQDKMIDAQTPIAAAPAVAPAAQVPAAPVSSAPVWMDPAFAKKYNLNADGSPAPKPSLMSSIKGKLGFADGGKVSLRSAIRAGKSGYVRGPGTETSDDVPAMLSDGEYVLPADVVDQIGPEELDRVVAQNHKPVHAYADGGAVHDTDHDSREYNMTLRDGTYMFADGGLVEDDEIASIGRYADGGMVRGAQQDLFPEELRAAQRPASLRTPIAANPAIAAESAAYEAARGPIVPGGGTAAPAAAPPSVPSRVGRVARAGVRGGIALAPVVGAFNALDTPQEEVNRNVPAGMEGTTMGNVIGHGIDFLGKTGDAATFGLAGRVGRMAAGGSFFDEPSAAPDASKPSVASLRVNPTQPAVAPVAAAAQPEPQYPVTATRTGNDVSITGDGPAPGRMMQTVEGRQAQLRDAYAPTQYGKSLEEQGNEQRARLAGDPIANARNDGTFSGMINARAMQRERNLAATLGQRDAESRRSERTTLRGQDITAAGATAKLAFDARMAARDQANKDRSFSLDVAKYGTDVGEKDRAARASADEALTKKLETRFRTTGPDGKNVVDADKVAAFTTAVSATIPQMVAQLEAQGSPQAIAKAKQLRARGVTALEPGDLDGLQQLFDTRDRMRSSRGLGPNAGTFKESDNLFDYRQSGVEKRTFGGDRVVTPAGSVSMNDLRYADGPANALLPDLFKVESNNLTRGLRRQ